MRMSTGFVRAARYDDKVRRVLFALLRNKGVPNDEILRAAAEFNKKVFEEITKRGIEKRDLVRIMCEFDLTPDKKIVWKWDTLKIEHYEEAKEIGAKLSALMAQLEERDRLLETLFNRLLKIAENLRTAASEIESLIDELKDKIALAGTESK